LSEIKEKAADAKMKEIFNALNAKVYVSTVFQIYIEVLSLPFRRISS